MMQKLKGNPLRLVPQGVVCTMRGDIVYQHATYEYMAQSSKCIILATFLSPNGTPFQAYGISESLSTKDIGQKEFDLCKEIEGRWLSCGLA